MPVGSSIISMGCIYAKIQGSWEMAIAWGSFGKCIARSTGLCIRERRVTAAKIRSIDCSFQLGAEDKARKLL